MRPLQKPARGRRSPVRHDQPGCPVSPGRCPHPTGPQAPTSRGPVPRLIAFRTLAKMLCVAAPSHALLGSRFCCSLPPQEDFPDPPAHHGSSLVSPCTPFLIPGCMVEALIAWARKQPGPGTHPLCVRGQVSLPLCPSLCAENAADQNIQTQLSAKGGSCV